MSFKRHKYHIVDPSPWPFFCGISVIMVAVSLVAVFYGFDASGATFRWSVVGLICNVSAWWRDVAREADVEQVHTVEVQRGIKFAFVLFIVSEFMLFVSFFWAYAHASIAPSTEVGSIWPPTGIELLPYQGIPLINTFLLAISGASITLAHRLVVKGNLYGSITAIMVTVILGTLFLGFQIYEYVTAPTDITDGFYGTSFYMITGLHGMHVLVGVVFLTVCLFRFTIRKYTREHHVSFEMAIWYWHFVDAIWLYVFVILYVY